MRNIKPLTEVLLADKRSNKPTYYGKNNIITAYIDFLAAAEKGGQKGIDASLKTLYEICVVPQKWGAQDNPNTVIQLIQQLLPDLFAKYCGQQITYEVSQKTQTATVYKKFTIKPPFLSSQWFFAYDNYFFDNQAPDYLIVYTLINDRQSLKKIALSKKYELIGVVDAWNQGSGCGGHFWAWIKDEFDTNTPRPWYWRDDMYASDTKANNTKHYYATDQELEKFIDSFKCPVLALYKKVSTTTSAEKPLLKLADSLQTLFR